jgi:uncharacterized membrane protein YbhN (UPF0104 family)
MARPWLTAALRIGLAALVFGVLLSRVEAAEFLSAWRDSRWWGIPAGVSIYLAVLMNAAFRWSLLLRAYGASRIPSLGRLYRLQISGQFVNMLPGAIGGDLLRGVVTRDAFGEANTAASMTIVLIERALGVLGLALLVTTMLTIRPIVPVRWPALAVGVSIAVSVLGGLAAGKRLQRFLPAPFPGLFQRLPEIQSFSPLLVAVVGSVLSHAMLGLMGYMFVWMQFPHVHLMDAMVLAPLAFAAVYFPLTVAGAGTRDAAMVLLFGGVGVPESEALVASLHVLATYLSVAAIGGCVTAVWSPELSA